MGIIVPGTVKMERGGAHRALSTVPETSEVLRTWVLLFNVNYSNITTSRFFIHHTKLREIRSSSAYVQL